MRLVYLSDFYLISRCPAANQFNSSGGREKGPLDRFFWKSLLIFYLFRQNMVLGIELISTSPALPLLD